MTQLYDYTEVVNALASARRLADFALSLGAESTPGLQRTICDHLGAVLADAILQAGLSYKSVVKVRVDRIVRLFPETATLAETLRLVERGSASEFLLWKHPEKIDRFTRLVHVLNEHDVEDTQLLRHWLQHDRCRHVLLKIDGVGPKTIDYLSCLVGVDCIAIDRHVRTFARRAGVEDRDYYDLQRMVSYAADLLNMSRRDFDFWIWRTVSSAPVQSKQYAFL